MGATLPQLFHMACSPLWNQQNVKREVKRKVPYKNMCRETCKTTVKMLLKAGKHLQLQYLCKILFNVIAATAHLTFTLKKTPYFNINVVNSDVSIHLCWFFSWIMSLLCADTWYQSLGFFFQAGMRLWLTWMPGLVYWESWSAHSIPSKSI